MDSVQQIVNAIFGGSIDVSKITTLFVAVWAVVQGVIAWRSKLAQIRSDKRLGEQNGDIKDLKEENGKLKETNTALANIIVTAYLSNPNIDPETKKSIAAEAKKLEKAADIDLSENASKIVDAIDSYVPGTTIADKKAELVAAAEAAEAIIDGVNEGTQSAIDSIHLE